MSAKLIVGIGGTPAPGSSTTAALRVALAAAERLGARTQLFDGAALARLPLYLTDTVVADPVGAEMIAAVRGASGLIIASPGYHGSVSGLVKNALDHLEALRGDARPYFDGMPVGLIATAWGWQATGSTLAALRSIVHALRGWPTPFGAAINSAETRFAGDRCEHPVAAGQLEMVGEQVARFVDTRVPDLV